MFNEWRMPAWLRPLSGALGKWLIRTGRSFDRCKHCGRGGNSWTGCEGWRGNGIR